MLVAGRDYTVEGGNLVFTAFYLASKGPCCGAGCRNCPFEPRWRCGATRLRPEFRGPDAIPSGS